MLAGSTANVWPYRGEGTPVSVLLLGSARGHTTFLSSESSTIMCFNGRASPSSCGTRTQKLPDHDVVFCAIGDAYLRGPPSPSQRPSCGARRRGSSIPLRRCGRRDGGCKRDAPGCYSWGCDGEDELWTRTALSGPNQRGRPRRRGVHLAASDPGAGVSRGDNFERVEAPEDLPTVLNAGAGGKEDLCLGVPRRAPRRRKSFESTAS